MQILPANRTRQSFGEKLTQGIGTGLDIASKLIQQHEQKKAMAQEEQTLNELGINVKGLSPEMKKVVVAEMLKSQGKDDLQNKRINQFNSLLFGQDNQNHENQQNNSRFAELSTSSARTSGQQKEQEEVQAVNQTKSSKYDPSEISDETILQLQMFDPQAAKLIQDQKNSSIKQKSDKEEIERKNKAANRKEQIEFHKESAKYDEDLFEKAKIAKNQQQTITEIDKALDSGNVKPSSIANVFKGMGKIGDKISEAVLNSDEAALLASIPTLLEGWKEMFGVRLSDADLRLLQDKLPSIGKNPKSNKAVLKILKKYSDATLLRSKIASDIKSKNGGLRPLGYADRIEERYDEMVKPVKIINPNNGNTIEIPAYLLSDAMASGATLADE